MVTMAASGVVPPETVQIAEDSYHRCAQEAFFHAFYERLLASDETVRQKFARTDFAKQNKLLQHGIGLLLIFGKRRNPSLIERIAVRHGPTDLNVPPALYPFFVESLIETVKQFDAEYSPAVDQAWRQALKPGIDFMMALHSGDTPEAGR